MGGSRCSSYSPHHRTNFNQRAPDNFEAASLPTTSPEERKRLLSFVVCGGGPTGVETAAEIYDFCQEDIMNYVCLHKYNSFPRRLTHVQYPKICREEVSIHVIQSREHILNTYSEAISNYAEVRTLPFPVSVSCSNIPFRCRANSSATASTSSPPRTWAPSPPRTSSTP